MLLTGKDWRVASSGEIANTDVLLDTLLLNRGIKDEDARGKFISDNEGAWHDPYLYNDMKKVVDIIVDAIGQHKKILVYGDYDCDGVTATAILVRYFRSHNCDVNYIVPQRTEHGYGLTENILDKVLSYNPQLVITVDCGITNCDTVKILKDKGVTVIVTDHHNVKDELPQADAIVCAKRPDNTYPFTDLCGAGVALKIVEALGRDGRYKVTPSVWRQAIEAAGIATIADLVSVVDENRTIIKKALRSMENPVNVGIREMLRLILTEGKTLDEVFISFNFVPRVNAAGRLYDSSEALKLFLEDDPKEAQAAANALTAQNEERKAIESEVFEAAVKQVENPARPECWSLVNTVGPIVVYAPGWHQGVLGIVAGRLAQHFRRSAIVFTDDTIEDGCAKGSGRAYGDYDLFGTLEKISDTLVNFGGHKKAAGMVVAKNKMKAFMEALEKASAETTTGDGEDNEDVVNAECELPFDMLNFDSYKTVCVFRPFGIGNKRPVFVTRNLIVSGVFAMSSGSHMRLDLTSAQGGSVSAVGFGMGEYLNLLKPGDKIDIAYTLNEYLFRGDMTLSLHLCDLKPHCGDGFLWEKAEIAENLYKSGLSTDQISKMGADKQQMVPDAADFGACYTVLRKFAGDTTSAADIDLLAKLVSVNAKTDTTPFKVMRCLDIFAEAGLIKLSRKSGKTVCFSFTKCTGDKPKLTETKAYKRLING